MIYQGKCEIIYKNVKISEMKNGTTLAILINCLQVAKEIKILFRQRMKKLERERDIYFLSSTFIHVFLYTSQYRLSGSCMVITDHLPAAPSAVLVHLFFWNFFFFLPFLFSFFFFFSFFPFFPFFFFFFSFFSFFFFFFFLFSFFFFPFFFIFFSFLFFFFKVEN